MLRHIVRRLGDVVFCTVAIIATMQKMTSSSQVGHASTQLIKSRDISVREAIKNMSFDGIIPSNDIFCFASWIEMARDFINWVLACAIFNFRSLGCVHPCLIVN